MVLVAGDGYPVPQSAALVQRRRSTVTRVLARSQQGGPDGVPHRRRPGRPRSAPATWAAAVPRVLDLDPHAVGVPSATGTLRLLRA
jgi:transposase